MKNYDSSCVLYSAIWTEGPLYYDFNKKTYKRKPNIKVVLKITGNSSNSSQNFTEFLNEVEDYNSKETEPKIFGITGANDEVYIMVYHGFCENCNAQIYKWCRKCQIKYLKNKFISNDKNINKFIQKVRLRQRNVDDNVFEWIPYDRLNNVKETETAAIYSAIWKDGPSYCKKKQTRESNKKVTLELYDSQNIIKLLKNINSECIRDHSSHKIYGITQDPESKNYILVIEYDRCEKCDEIYNDDKYILYKWCVSCQISNLNKNWTSGNERIDNFIQEVQSDINDYYDVIFEWVPYDQFSDIKKIGRGGFATIYSAIWKDGPLIYKEKKHEYKRNSNEKVALKCLDNSQNISDKFLNEIKRYSTSRRYKKNILLMYGISQDPNTKNYIMVLKYAKGGDLNMWLTNFEDINWRDRMRAISGIVKGIRDLHEDDIVHRDLHIGNILTTNHVDKFGIFISDMGLCGDVNNMDENKLYGVMPYMAPELFRKELYTKAADIYSIGMIMYFVATGRQPFADREHNRYLALDICRGKRPEIKEWEAPKDYINIMKKCWDSNPDNRPDVFSLDYCTDIEYDIKRNSFFKDFDEDYYKENILFKSNQSTVTRTQSIYKSQLIEDLL
ncbi:hypothetical protein RclHR1_05000010 [Rhizophagus clarus]|uniref:Protein kinase domain-containing protein n=1 Tax=Rhizophagus clarus TaxID=94130 RepID=A0A2Z6SDG4_9GLOM|nr:hypothetical protein RclHR1_05000010 [Rhizophagus clarus]